MIVSEALQKILVDHKLIDLVEKTALDAIRYVPKIQCGFSEVEYFSKILPNEKLTNVEKAILYGLYRQKLDQLHGGLRK